MKHILSSIGYDYVEAGYSEVSAVNLHCTNDIEIRLVRDTDITIGEQTFTIFTLDQHNAHLIINGNVDNVITVEYRDLVNQLLESDNAEYKVVPPIPESRKKEWKAKIDEYFIKEYGVTFDEAMAEDSAKAKARLEKEEVQHVALQEVFADLTKDDA